MISQKFIEKYMSIARTVGTVYNPCFSRQIGVIITDPNCRRIIGTGYNGPPRDTPHCDDERYLKGYFWPQLTEEEKEKFFPGLDAESFSKQYHGCKQCPRRLVNAGPGERSLLCSCEHGERNAIYNSGGESLENCVMFCWCGLPCIDCTKAIINSGITSVYCLYQRPMYHPQSMFLFEEKGVEVIELKTDTAKIEMEIPIILGR